jgi:beta-glucosidase/6-phospho-beta-glucosidase/beta-galactosidase
VFKSFFFAGFECATGYNKHREWIDQIAATQHDIFADEDYRLLAETGLYAAREGVRWPLVDHKGTYDFSTVQPHLDAARKHGIEVVWDLFHYGYPDDVDLFSPTFPRRFADYCHAAARHIAAHTEGTCYFTPVNEPSFLAWAAGDAGLFAPHCQGRGCDLKVALARASIEGIKAIRATCPDSRIVNVDALCRVVAPVDQPHLQGDVDYFNSVAVFESWDMIAGRLHPELGGSLDCLDIIGINYYWTNQWDITKTGTPLEAHDPRCEPLSELVRTVWNRYGHEMLITETSHVGDMRPSWIAELASEARTVRLDGIPLQGVCLYPILGMPEWHAQDEWTRMGLWDLIPQSPTLARVPHEPAMAALRQVLHCASWETCVDDQITQAMHFEVPHKLRRCLDSTA